MRAKSLTTVFLVLGLIAAFTGSATATFEKTGDIELPVLSNNNPHYYEAETNSTVKIADGYFVDAIFFDWDGDGTQSLLTAYVSDGLSKRGISSSSYTVIKWRRHIFYGRYRRL